MSRVVWINHRNIFHPQAGGAERTIFEVARGLVRAGHDVEWISVAGPSGSSPKCVDGIQLRELQNNVAAHVAVPLLARRLSENDVVVDDLAHAVPWFTPLVRSGPNVAFFRHLHRRTLPGQVSPALSAVLSGLEWSYPMIYGNTAVVAESASSIDDLRALGISAERIVKISPGVDLTLFRPMHKSSRPTLVYFGGLKEYKRPADVVMLVRELSPVLPTVHCTVVGDGPMLAPVRQLAARLGVGDRVTFTGRLSRERLAETVGTAWINIHCAVSEGWCLSALEAAASGVPTVGYRVPGLRDSVREGASGILVNDRDVVGLARACMRVISGPATWWEGARHYAENFPWTTTVKRWNSLIESLSNAAG